MEDDVYALRGARKRFALAQPCFDPLSAQHDETGDVTRAPHQHPELHILST